MPSVTPTRRPKKTANHVPFPPHHAGHAASAARPAVAPPPFPATNAASRSHAARGGPASSEPHRARLVSGRAAEGDFC